MSAFSDISLCAISINDGVERLGLYFSTLAGLAGSSGSTDGTGSSARFNYPSGIAVSTEGNLFVADQANNTIRKVTSAGVVTTLAGLAGSSGSADGTGSTARFYNLFGVAVDTAGNVYVADTYNHTIRKVTSAGVVTTLAGSAGNIGTADGTGSVARFNFPFGIAVSTEGNVFVADTQNQTVRKVTTAGVVTTLAGLAGSSGSADGTGSSARFYNLSGIAVSTEGNLFVADQANNTIRKVTSAGVVTTLAGLAGSAGSTDGTGSVARFNNAGCIAVTSAGNLFVADQDNHTIRKVTSAGVVTTLAGLAGSAGSTDGAGSDARFSYPLGIAVNTAGNVYVADRLNRTIRNSNGILTAY
jgi:sugar lactone lactonase YvrE